MAASFDDARAMVESTAANSACLAVGHIRRFMFLTEPLGQKTDPKRTRSSNSNFQTRRRAPSNGAEPATCEIRQSSREVEVSLHRNEIIRARPDNLILFELNGRSAAAMPNEHLRQDMFQRELGDRLQAIHSGGDPFVSGASATTAIRIIDRCYHMRRPLHLREPKKPSAKSIKAKTTLVTGASGFVGSRLVDKARGRCELSAYQKQKRLFYGLTRSGRAFTVCGLCSNRWIL